jgi:hypothetical protein
MSKRQTAKVERLSSFDTASPLEGLENQKPQATRQAGYAAKRRRAIHAALVETM